MRNVIHNPLTGNINAVTHTDTETTFHAYPDGSFEIDMIINDEVLIFTVNANTTAAHWAEFHAKLFKTE